MLKEFVESVAKMAVEAAAPQVRAINLEVDNSWLDDKGELRLFYARPPRREHEAASLSAIVDFAERFPRHAVWYSAASVCCLLDDEDRREDVVFTPSPSAAFTLLSEWAKKRPSLSQRDLIFQLRTTLYPCLASAGNLVELLRRVNFQAAEGSASEVGRGKSSVGKTIRAEIQGDGELPEYVKLVCPIFNGPLAHIRAPLQCCLEPDERTQTFQFFPVPGEVEDAIVEAEGGILADLLRMYDAEGREPLRHHYGTR